MIPITGKILKNCGSLIVYKARSGICGCSGIYEKKCAASGGTMKEPRDLLKYRPQGSFLWVHPIMLLKFCIPASAPYILFRSTLERAVAAEFFDQRIENLRSILIAVYIGTAHGQVDQVVRQIQADECGRYLAY